MRLVRLALPSILMLVLVACSSPPPPDPDGGARCSPACDPATEECDAAKNVCVPKVQTGASVQIANIRQASGAVNLPVAEALVTYVFDDPDHPEVRGFFVQATKLGPAVFVRVDPGSISPRPEVGDLVSFTATQVLQSTRVEVRAITGYERLSSGHDVMKLVQDLSRQGDLLDRVDQYDGELVRIEGTFNSDWIGPGGYIPMEGGLHFAVIESLGMRSSRFVMTSARRIADKVGRATGCTFTVPAAPLRKGSLSVELWAVRPEDFEVVGCPDSSLVKAIALSPTTVRLNFTRPLDPATVGDAGEVFTFSGDLMAAGVEFEGRDVIVTTNTQTSRQPYEVSVSAEARDTLGGKVVIPEAAKTFLGFFPRASLVLNEIDCMGPEGRDLIELRALSAGSTADLWLEWTGKSTPAFLGAFPDAEIAEGDLVVVHLNANPFRDDVIYPEVESRTQYDEGTNYPGAWDFPYEDAQCDNSNGVLRLRGLRNETLDAVALYNPKLPPNQRPPEYGPVWLRQAQEEGAWAPATCGGQPCGDDTIPSAAGISVNSADMGTRMGTRWSVMRRTGADSNTRADWNDGFGGGARPNTFGLPND